MAPSLLEKKEDAKNNYEIELDNAKKAVYPQSGSRNHCRATARLASVNEYFEKYDAVFKEYLKKEVFADQTLKQAAKDEYSTFVDEHEDWYYKAIDLVSDKDEEEKVPVETVAQKKARYNLEVKNLQEEIKKIVANVESSLDQPNLPTSGALNNYEKVLSNALDELRSDRLKSLYERRIEFSPEKGGEYTTEAGEFGKGIRDRVFATQGLIAAKRDAINVSNVQNNEVTRNVPQKGFSNVKKIDPPEFNGDRKKYFAFKRQWKDLVSPDLVGKARTEIAYLNKMTPERDILDNFNTMEEAWEYLDTRYGNADKISQELIDEYLKFQFKGRNDHQKLVELNEKLQNPESKIMIHEYGT